MFNAAEEFKKEMFLSNIEIVKNRFTILIPRAFGWRNKLLIKCKISVAEEIEIADWLHANCKSNALISLSHIYKLWIRDESIISLHFQNKRDLMLAKLRFINGE